MADRDLLHKASDLLARAPQLSTATQSPEELQWLGDLRALVRATNDIANGVNLSSAMDLLKMPTTGMLRAKARPTILQCLHNAISDLKMRVPDGAPDSFVPAGQPFDALMAVTRVFATATRSVLIVDPYASTNLLTDFATQVPDAVAVHVLGDSSRVKEGLKAAADRWRQQHQTARPLEVRLSTPDALHDRLVIIDEKMVWLTGQSFNHYATRSPTSLVQLEGNLSELKLAAYLAIWQSGTPI